MYNLALFVHSVYLFVTVNRSWKESLNSDGQQFYQYQQKEQSPLTLAH
jgi:hypothetical protein